MRLRTSAVIIVVMTLLLVSSTSALATEEPGVVLSPEGLPMAVRTVGPNGTWVTNPCGRLVLLSDAEPVGEVNVVLDPGHGGSRDTGAVGRNGLPEKQLNLEVGVAAKALLEERGVNVLLTRTADYAERLWVRALLADRSGADLMLSIHHNAPRMAPSSTPGTEVFVQYGSAESERLGGLAYEAVVEALSGFDIGWVAAADSGVMTVLNTRGADAYGMLRHPETPTALIELGYLANPAEAELFATEEYVQVAATAVADAVIAYLGEEPSSVTLGEGRIFNPQPGISGSQCVDPPLSSVIALADRVRLTRPTPQGGGGFQAE